VIPPDLLLLRRLESPPQLGGDLRGPLGPLMRLAEKTIAILIVGIPLTFGIDSNFGGPRVLVHRPELGHDVVLRDLLNRSWFGRCFSAGIWIDAD